MSNALGIYFGPKLITLVEVNGKKVVNSFQILRSLISSGELEEKVPDDIKMVALLKEELRKIKQEAKEGAICLSGKDLIIRTFEIPVLPANELPSVINFEVKKYIPFKVEDLVSSYQISPDKPNNRNQVLFVGVKKDVLDKHVSIVSQLDTIKVSSVEYSVFSILRFLKLTNFNSKGIVAVVSMDFKEDDEVNFTIMENGFPLFSRDITLSGGPDGMLKPQESAAISALEKLKSEIRISLDYYHRKFSVKKISRIYFISDEEQRTDLEAFFNEIALPAHFINVSRFMGMNRPFSLGLVKAYGASLSKQLRTNLKIDLLSSRLKTKVVKESTYQLHFSSLATNLKVDPRFVIVSLLICLATFGYMFYQKFPIQLKIEEVLARRTQVANVSPDAMIEELEILNKEYYKKVESLKTLVTKQIYLTKILDAIPGILPKDIRLTNIVYRVSDQGRPELSMQGVVYLGNGDEERDVISGFVTMLNKTEDVTQYFKNITLVNIERTPVEKIIVTKFIIDCKS